MTLSPGSRVGPYTIEAQIGAGGMGEVYRARDPRLARDVAIKVLPASVSSLQDRLRRFEQEARAAAALSHPNILAVYEFGQHNDAPYIVSELLEGETLRERLGHGALSVRKATEYAVQIAHGLAAAHDRGIVHRDLKPENVFLTSDGHVKILDFGLAKLAELEPSVAASVQPTAPPQTMAGVVLGTVGYMAPEQVRGHIADRRVDLFALGAVLFEMLAGRRAFVGDSPMDVMTAILQGEPPALSSAEHHIPAGLVRIVERCLEKTPAARFQSATDSAFALEGLSSSAVPVDEGTILSRRPFRRTSAYAWSIAAVSTLIAVTTIGWSLRRAEPPSAAVTQFAVGLPGNSLLGSSFAISHNGRMIAFTASTAGLTQLWVRRLEAVAAQVVPGTLGASLPFWSPDDTFIAFFAEGRLKKVAAGGGSPQSLSDAPSPRGGSWGSDNVIVFAPTSSGPIHRVPSGGGKSSPVTAPDFKGESSHRLPWFLPDGRHFLYGAGVTTTMNFYVASLDGGSRKLLLSGVSNAIYAEPGYVLFTRAGALFAQRFDATSLQLSGDAFPVAENLAPTLFTYTPLAASNTGTLVFLPESSAGEAFAWFSRSGMRLETIAAPTNADQFALSPDRRRLAVSARSPQGGKNDIWLLDLSRHTSSRLTFDAADHGGPTWSPGGSRLVFYRQGSEDLVRSMYEMPTSGASGAQEILRGTDVLTMAGSGIWDWSRDGAFVLVNAAGVDVWALPRTGDRKPFQAVQFEGNQVHAQFSPDSHWLAYASSESGAMHVYVQGFPSGAPRVQVSTESAANPEWREDGRELYYLTADNHVMAVPVIITDGVIRVGAAVELFAVDTARDISTPVRRIFQPDREGQRFLVRTTNDRGNALLVTQNWYSR